MPVLSEKKIDNTEKLYLTFPQASPKKNSKKKKKGPKLKFRKQFVSFSSIIELEKEVEDNLKKSLIEFNMKNASNRTSSKPRQSQSEKFSGPRLPSLSKTSPSSCASSSMVNSNTPRAMSAYRVPLSLPLGLQPGPFERRKKLPLLSAIKPENERSERERFIRSNFNYNPLFIYRFPAEPELLERLGTPSDKYLKHVRLSFYSFFTSLNTGYFFLLFCFLVIFKNPFSSIIEGLDGV